MRLFYRAQTGRPLRVAWALEEIGVDYEPVALSAEECHDEAYRQRHPLGRVPALELDDGQVLFESTAIVLAIADLYPDARLTGPLGSALRTQVYAWSIMAMTELERATLGAWSRTEHVEDEYRRRQLRAVARASTAVGDQLADRPFLLGAELTAADIVLGGVLAVSRFAGVLDAAPATSSATSIVCKHDLRMGAPWRAPNRCLRRSATPTRWASEASAPAAACFSHGSPAKGRARHLAATSSSATAVCTTSHEMETPDD